MPENWLNVWVVIYEDNEGKEMLLWYGNGSECPIKRSYMLWEGSYSRFREMLSANKT